MAPRIARAHALGTPQRRLKLAMGLGMAVLAASDGGQKIAAKFRDTFSARPEAEIWEHLMEYLFRSHRSLYESMPSCVLRESLLREQAIMAMKTVEPALEEILHPVIRTYLLMQNAAVPAQARISILSVCHNNCDNEAVSTAPRQSIGDKELVTLDASAPRGTFKHEANFGVIADDEHGKSELEEFAGDGTSIEVRDNWWDGDPLEEIDEDTFDNIMSDYVTS